MTRLPKISVVMPCFNAERYVRAALRSVFAQEWPDVEVIVIDDGSSDQSARVVSECFPEVRLLRQANQGVAAARNRGIETATGDLIAFLDADDFWLPGKLQSQWELLASNPAAQMAYAAWIVWTCNDPGPSADYLASVAVMARSAEQWSGPSGWIYPQLLLDCEVWTSTVLAKRSLFREIGLFDASLPIGEDYDLWLRASQATEILRVPRPLALYRMHASSITKKAPAENFQALVVSKALQRWGYVSPGGGEARPEDVRKALARTWRNFAGAHVAAGNLKLARRGAASAVRLDPMNVKGWGIFARIMARLGAQVVSWRAIQMVPEVSPDNPQSSTVSRAEESRTDQWFPAVAVWASGISATLYFVFSNGIHGYFRFLFESVAKVLRALG